MTFSRLRLLASTVVLTLAAGSGWAQARYSGASTVSPSRVDLYGGYGYFSPNNVTVNGVFFNDIHNPNATVSLTGYFTRHIGLQVEGGYFNAPRPAGSPIAQSIYTAEAGPVFRVGLGRWVPYVHVLGGFAKTRGPAFQPLKWGYGMTAGGGVDYVLPFFNNLMAIRPIQADFQYSHTDYGTAPSAALANNFGVLNMPAVKLSGGLVLRFGDMEPQLALAESCSAQPSSVYPGDPINISASTVNENRKKRMTYSWETNGGTLTANSDSATVDTAGAAPGTYAVRGHVSQGGRNYQQASCVAEFVVRQYEPPTVTCTASPSSVMSGNSSTITANGFSRSNRPLTYSITSNGGKLTGQGGSATLNTSGLPSGIVVATCTVMDDRGKSASATASVAVNTPVATRITPQYQTMCTVSFERDRARPMRVDNEAKACLDDIALNMSHDSSATLQVVGNYASGETIAAGGERAINVRLYLTQDRGIDPSRIDLREGDQSGRTVESVLLPPGTVSPLLTARTFDPATIRSHGQAYGRSRVRARTGASRPRARVTTRRRRTRRR